MSRNAISANPEHYIFKFFRGSMPPDPIEGLTKYFLAAAWLRNFFHDRLPPKQKILDRTLPAKKTNVTPVDAKGNPVARI